MKEKVNQTGFSEWRIRILDVATLWTAIIAFVFILWMLLTPIMDGVPGYRNGAVAAFGLVSIAAIRRFPYHLRVACFIATMFSSQILSLYRVGFAIGSYFPGLVAVVACGLFLGVRYAVAGWLLSVGILLLAAFLISGGAVETAFNPDVVDPRNLAVGIRVTLSYAVFSVLIAVGLAVLIDRLSRSLTLAQQSLQDQLQAQSEREAAELDQRKAEQELERALRLELVGHLASGVAHDFNNLLQVILNWSYLLQADVGEKAEEACAEIDKSCLVASKICQQLLSLGRRDIHTPQGIVLSDLVAELSKSILSLLPDDIRLSIKNRAPKCIQIFADTIQMQQVLINLAINARDAMETGGELTIELSEDCEDGFILLSVRDTGTGMDETTRNQVFEAFFTTKPEGSGTGLGLATVQRIVDRHHGKIQVESELGQGTCFTIKLPVFVPEAEEASARPQAKIAHDSASILVVDDDDRVRESLVQILESVGHQVAAASSGDEALLQIKQGNISFDLLCTDAVMPGIPVREFLNQFSKLQPNAAVLLCSGYVESELLRRGIEMHEVEFLAKPFTREQLLEKINAGILNINS